MNDKIHGNSRTDARFLSAIRRMGTGISAMAGNPWGKPDGEGSDASGGGDGPRNPWTTPGPDKGRARGPSALDELLRRGRGGGGGGNGSGPGGGSGFGMKLPEGSRLVSLGALAIVAIWLLTTSLHVVPPEQEGVVTRLGSYSRTLSPGFKLTLPAPIERVEFVDVLAINETKIGATDSSVQNFVLTQDQNIINLGYEVRWQIREPEQYLFQLAEQEDTIREVAESAMRATVANFTLNDAIGPKRANIEGEVRTRMQDLLNQYGAGVNIVAVQLQRAVQPDQVTDAFNKVTAAQQTRQSNINQAQAYRQQVLELARGDTEAFNKIYEQYKLAPEVTKRRLYYQTMERVLAPIDKVIVEDGGVTSYLPLPELKRRARDATITTQPGSGQ